MSLLYITFLALTVYINLGFIVMVLNTTILIVLQKYVNDDDEFRPVDVYLIPLLYWSWILWPIFLIVDIVFIIACLGIIILLKVQKWTT